MKVVADTLSRPGTTGAISELTARFGDALKIGDAIRTQHGAIEGMIGYGIPDAARPHAALEM